MTRRYENDTLRRRPSVETIGSKWANMKWGTVWVIAVGAAVAVLAGAAAWARLGELAAYPEPVGIDG